MRQNPRSEKGDSGRKRSRDSDSIPIPVFIPIRNFNSTERVKDPPATKEEMVVGSEELRYEISQNAYIKLVLHAIKHNTSAVNGVLVGRTSPNNDAVVEISDSVPLFHSHLGLLPPLEIALIMIEEHYGAQGLGIVGYFHANERRDDANLGIVAKNIGDHISRYFPQAALLLLDDKRLESLAKSKDGSPVLQLYTRDASKIWRAAGSDGGSRLITKEPAANTVLSDYILSEKWQDVVDFDDHLDDITKDWLNPKLFK
ncbi:hypothetical protein Tsubulata_033066 [Turnera subulata]|uniref:MPN domain-containing protein n=1 Tax=Turnera subulata TaxID=218843 RepID=A0A9Q0GAC7_9ROSI|nr:hypothetical protein Tsubulata_033066 [Turnera subulata]